MVPLDFFRFQPMLLVRGATAQLRPQFWITEQFRSTLPVRGATHLRHATQDRRDISIHAPREGSDLSLQTMAVGPMRFQSTLPGRGATKDHFAPPRVSKFQSTLPVRGATQVMDRLAGFEAFQSTLPVRGATANISKMLRVILDRFSNF